MANPIFDPYSTNGKVPTGRTGVIGFQAELYARVRSTVVSGSVKSLAGHSKVSAFGKTVEVVRRTVSARYPTGMITYTYYLADGYAPGYPAGFYPDAPCPYQGGLYAYIDVPDVQEEATPPPGWPPGTPYYVWVPGPEPDPDTCQKNESRLVIDLGEWVDDTGATRQSEYHLAAGGAGAWTSTAYTSPSYFHRWAWAINSTYNISGTATIEMSVPSAEYIEIAGQENVVPGLTDITRDFTATFTAEGDYVTYGSPVKAKCTIDVNGASTGFDVAESNITGFPVIAWQALADVYGDTGVWSKTVMATAKLGTKGLWFNVPESYAYSSTNNDVNIADNTVSVSSAGGGNSSKPYSGSISWNYPPIAYQFLGNARDIAGTAISPPVTYQESYADNEWTGASSPVYRFSGEWTVNITTIDGTIGNYSDTGSADYLSFTEIVTGYWQARWYKDDKPVADLSFSLNVTLGPGETYPYFKHTDDYKLWIKYPRSRDALSMTVDTADVAIDDFMSGWTGENCTVTTGAGGITVSVVGANARIYKTTTRKLWPPHRWIKLVASKTAATFDAHMQVDDYGLGHNNPVLIPNNQVYEYDSAPKKRWSTFLSNSGNIYFDAYSPDIGRDRDDTVQSLMEQFKPFDTGSWTGNNLRWSWGIGKITTIEFYLTQGAEYTFESLTAVAAFPGQTASTRLFSHPPLSEPLKFNAGEVVVPSVHHSVDGRRWIEAATMRNSALNPSGMQYTSLAEMVGDYHFPLSTDDAYGITDISCLLSAWNAAWWDGTHSLYTSEDVLFNADYTPAFWLDPYEDVIESSILRSPTASTIKVRPIYNNVTLHWFYGDGINSTAECLKIYFGQYYMSLIEGLLFKSGKTPAEQSPAETDFSGTVTSNDRDTPDESITTDAYSRFVTADPAIYISHQVKLSAYGKSLSSGYTEDYIDNREWYRMVLDIITLTGTGSDLLIDNLTGQGVLVYPHDNKAWVRRTSNFGRTFGSEAEIGGVSTPGSLCLFACYDPMNSIGLVWDDGTDIKCLRTTDYFSTNWGVSTLLSGATQAKTRVHTLTGVMLVAGWYNDSIIVGRSYDYGKSLTGGTITAINNVADAAFGLDVAPDSRCRWCITCQDAISNEYVTYWSTDHGLTWSLAS